MEKEIKNDLIEVQPTRAVQLPDGRWATEKLAKQIEISFMAEVQRYYSDNFGYITSDQPTLSILTNIARHFAQWQKEQMMKGAVEGEVQLAYTDNTALIYCPYKGHSNDKVKLIIVKED